MFDLALQVERRRLAAARLTGAPPAELANMLLRVRARCDNAGDRAGALASITEAVELYRALAAANPAEQVARRQEGMAWHGHVGMLGSTPRIEHVSGH